MHNIGFLLIYFGFKPIYLINKIKLIYFIYLLLILLTWERLYTLVTVGIAHGTGHSILSHLQRNSKKLRRSLEEFHL